MMRSCIALVLTVAALAGASLVAQDREKPFVPVSDEMLWKPDPANASARSIRSIGPTCRA